MDDTTRADATPQTGDASVTSPRAPLDQQRDWHHILPAHFALLQSASPESQCAPSEAQRAPTSSSGA